MESVVAAMVAMVAAVGIVANSFICVSNAVTTRIPRFQM